MEGKYSTRKCFNGDNNHLPVPPHWPSIVSRHQFASPAASDHSNLELHPQNYKSTYQSSLPFYSLPFSPIQTQVPGPSSRSNGVQFELQTLPVNAKLVGDGDGMTVHVNTEDPRESGTVPLEVHEATIERRQAQAIGDYARADALYKFIVNCGYRVVIINNEEILAREYRIRLRGIDAPEMNMEYGQEAKDELKKLIQQKPLTIHVYGKDPYDRLVGDVYVDGIFVQERLLREGCAWHYEAYDKRPAFAQWQKEAQNEGRGLWANPNPVEPWEFKKMERIRKNAERPYQNSGKWKCTKKSTSADPTQTARLSSQTSSRTRRNFFSWTSLSSKDTSSNPSLAAPCSPHASQNTHFNNSSPFSSFEIPTNCVT
ncbi:hypothetical protein FCM35_KLT22003 [Carex littledalei]|uniref:TNase-like domain-containing protein n=1 Tax=Carex littledalei TaxID=544730 RepID=A0A833QHC6_9POAL|nr:hypothetical protein FCM35_KLT22003 [Carex littledalei]